MKKYIKIDDSILDNKDIFGMTNLNPRKTGLDVVIWSDGNGEARNVQHNLPRVKIFKKDGSAAIEVSIESNPKILSQNIGYHNSNPSTKKQFQRAIDYVGRNYDIFLKHYEDSDYKYDDEDMFKELRERGEYR